MRFSTAAATLAAVTPLVAAHGVGLPDIVGLDLKDLRTRNLLGNLRDGALGGVSHGKFLERRQDDRECGEGIGSCPAGKCCSISGFCGTEDAYCYSPGCQFKYGPACVENNPPKGESTEKYNRNHAGKVPYGGAGIYKCVKNGTVALTYDDGPMKKFTSHILDLFKKYNAKGTFFVTGNNINKGQIDTTDEFVEVIKRMDKEGHQIASHTWSHLDLSNITAKERLNQMVYLEMALNNIIQKIPTYMRPPYSSCTLESGCERQLSELGYHIAYFDVDTDDYNHPNSSTVPKENFKGLINETTNTDNPWITIGHDILEPTAMDLTEFMLKTITDLGYKAVTIGECLGDPEGSWYRTSNGTAYVAESEYPKIDMPYPNVTPSGGYPPMPKETETESSGASPTGGSTPEQKEGSASAVSRNMMISIAALILPTWFAFA